MRAFNHPAPGKESDFMFDLLRLFSSRMGKLKWHWANSVEHRLREGFLMEVRGAASSGYAPI